MKLILVVLALAAAPAVAFAPHTDPDLVEPTVAPTKYPTQTCYEFTLSSTTVTWGERRALRRRRVSSEARRRRGPSGIRSGCRFVRCWRARSGHWQYPLPFTTLCRVFPFPPFRYA